jgi:hypothetical protein
MAAEALQRGLFSIHASCRMEEHGDGDGDGWSACCCLHCGRKGAVEDIYTKSSMGCVRLGITAGLVQEEESTNWSTKS